MSSLERRVEELEAENARLKRELDSKTIAAAKALASFQQRSLLMEITRQQNEDLDRLAAELARAKKLEEIRGQEIEASARLKSEFLANFSHEIRTPLNGILGYCDLVLREEGQRLTPHGRRDLNVIKMNAKTLLALINDILDLSKIEAGRVEIVNEHVDMEALVDECGSTVREILRGKQVELRTFVDAGAKDVFTDPLKLKQVLLNLLSNAAKFTDTGEVVLTATAQGPQLTIVVEDTGAGIPSDQLAHIFEKFRQVDGSPSRRIGGTGLGLAIVQRDHPGVPAALVTGHVDGPIVNEVAAMGATMLSKPLDEQALLPFLQRVIAREHGFAKDFSERLNAVTRGFRFSPREHEILAWFVAGGTREGYLAFSGMAESTFKTHVKHILAKSSTSSLAESVSTALRRVVVRNQRSDPPGAMAGATKDAIDAAARPRKAARTGGDEPA